MVNSSDYWNKDYELYDSNSKGNQEAMLYKNGHAYFASIVGVKNIKQVIEISADNIENLYLLAEGTYIIVVKQ